MGRWKRMDIEGSESRIIHLLVQIYYGGRPIN
jgi:hypothetical protein